MKKLLSYVGLVLVSAFVLVGCTPKEDTTTPATPEIETNAVPPTP